MGSFDRHKSHYGSVTPPVSSPTKSPLEPFKLEEIRLEAEKLPPFIRT
jgi:hypothetical protein